MRTGKAVLLSALLVVCTLQLHTVHAANAGDCSVTFKGQDKKFDGCRTGLASGVDVYWTISSGTIETLFSGKPEKGGYVGWGWGSHKMVGSSAAVVFVDPSSSKPRLEDFYLRAESTDGVKIDSKQVLSVKEADQAADGTLMGYFVRPLGSNVKEGVVDAIWAVGPSTSGNVTLSDHKSAHATSKFDLTSTGKAQDGGGGGDGSEIEGHWVFHGFVLGIAWFLVAPLGIFWMRFLKKFNPRTFQIHRVVMVTVLLLTLIGFLIGLVKGKREEMAHFVIGCIVASLTIIQVLIGIFRPKHESKLRGLFYLIHSQTGRASYIMGVVNCFVGLGLLNAKAYWYVICALCVIAAIALFVVFQFLLKSQFPTKAGTHAVAMEYDSTTNGNGESDSI